MGEGYRVLGYIRGGGDMRVGTLVKHIEWEYTGIVLGQSVSTSDRWFVHFSRGVIQDRWCSECELEVLCE